MISTAYAMQLVQQYLKTSVGKDALAQAHQKGIAPTIGNTDAQAKQIVEEIRRKFCSLVCQIIPSFRSDAVHTTIGYDERGNLCASISVDENALRRESLHYMNHNLSIGHGEGVDDILALFTHGYRLNKRPYGFWVRPGGDSMARIGARIQRDPNPFLIDLVNKLNAEYANQCVVSLNDEYKA